MNGLEDISVLQINSEVKAAIKRLAAKSTREEQNLFIETIPGIRTRVIEGADCERLTMRFLPNGKLATLKAVSNVIKHYNDLQAMTALILAEQPGDWFVKFLTIDVVYPPVRSQPCAVMPCVDTIEYIHPSIHPKKCMFSRYIQNISNERMQQVFYWTGLSRF